ncbi:alpha/beta hydrolase [Nocardia zapadnayensis]|nr:alpha/beta hydrolase [Nocardia zapadnayensis]MCX0269835.1 alpha/beta hydrolase [Nocardia zapadnayensis]
MIEGAILRLASAVRDRLMKLAPDYAKLLTLPSSATADTIRPAVSEFLHADRSRRLPTFGEDATANRSFDTSSTPRGETGVGNAPARGNDIPGNAGSGGGPRNTGMRGGGEHPGDFVVTLPDGHRLQCRVEGPEDGTPIVQLHGAPGSRVDTAPPELLDRVGVRLVTYDRPGYGGSDPQEGLRVTDAAKHVEAIADHLGIDRFAVVGRSGGTPYAAAVAAGLPDRVTRLGLLVPIAPPALMKEEHLVGMTQQVGLTKSFEEVTALKFANFNANPTDPMGIIGIPWENLGSVDREIVAQHSENLCNTYAEGLRNGAGAWVEDLKTYRKDRPWGFEIGDIECPTLVWTAGGDGFTPPAHAERIAAQLSPGQGRLYTIPEDEVGHFGAQEIKPGAYAWLAGKEDLARFPADPPPGHTPGSPIPTTLEQWKSLAEPSTG